MDKPSENRRDIVAIGGSASGLEALEALLIDPRRSGPA